MWGLGFWGHLVIGFFLKPQNEKYETYRHLVLLDMLLVSKIIKIKRFLAISKNFWQHFLTIINNLLHCKKATFI